MTRKESANDLAVAEDIGKGKAEAIIATLFDAIGDALQRGEEVTIHGFGKFSVSQRKAREGRNPATGKPIKIKAKKSIRFKAHKKLADEVNG